MIGLTTTRGSGTNGYIQRNLAHVAVRKQEDYKPHYTKAQTIFKKPNQDILEHERKRKIELKCLEWEDQMKNSYSQQYIETAVNVFRQSLIDKHNEQMKVDTEVTIDDFKKDLGGRIVGKGINETSIANNCKNQKFKNDLHIRKNVKKFYKNKINN